MMPRPEKSDRYLGAEFDEAIGGNRDEAGRIRRLPLAKKMSTQSTTLPRQIDGA
jgi:hypothetical protein